MEELMFGILWYPKYFEGSKFGKRHHYFHQRTNKRVTALDAGM